MRPPAIQAERLRCRRVGRRRRGPFNEAACNTGGTPTRSTGPSTPTRSFNEAACNTGGTPRPHAPAAEGTSGPSMRPPAIQAERRATSRCPARRDTAPSMRPPAIQAERLDEIRRLREAVERFNEAACNTGGTPPAVPHPGLPPAGRFNEAACNTGGTPGPLAPILGSVPPASMRPPAIQAERPAARRAAPAPRPCFNEAACNTGGTPPHRPSPPSGADRASMRPPAIQAERPAAAAEP